MGRGGEGRGGADDVASNPASSSPSFFLLGSDRFSCTFLWVLFQSWSRMSPVPSSPLSLSLSHAQPIPPSPAWWKHKRVNQLYRLWLCPTGLDNSQMSHVRRLQKPSRLALSLPAGTLMWTPPCPPTIPSPMSQIVWESPSLSPHPFIYFTFSLSYLSGIVYSLHILHILGKKCDIYIYRRYIVY